MLSASRIEIARAVLRSGEVLPGTRVGVLFSGGRSSALLWRLVRDHIDGANPVFVDTGLHPPGVHDLLHRLYGAGGFTVDIRRNDGALRAVADGRLRIGDLPPDQAAEARLFTTADSVPYSDSEPVVRRLLFDRPMAEVRSSHDVLFTGERWERDPTLAFMERIGGAVVVRPMLSMSGADVDAVIRDLGVPFAGSDSENVGGIGKNQKPAVAVDPVEDIIERAMAMASPAREEYVLGRLLERPLAVEFDDIMDMIRERLALWKGQDRFGHE